MADPNYAKQLADIATALQQIPKPTDYSQQLNEIVVALNRPGTPGWIIALASSVLGFLGSAALQRLQLFDGDAHKRGKMRRLLYVDLTEIFCTVEAIMMRPDTGLEGDMYTWRWEQLNMHLGFQREKYIKDNQDIFVQLSEYAVAESVYLFFHRILESQEEMHSNSHFATQILADAIHRGGLDANYFRKVSGKKGDFVVSRAKVIHDEAERRLAQGLPRVQADSAEPGI
jgi:hypothetical protein